MSDYFIDASAIGNEYQVYSDVPTTWAVPQDGNGLAGPGHAAAVPVCELTIAAVPTSGAITVYGASVTLTGVLSAASTAACATALASSINATTTALATGVCKLLLPLNRFVYARVKPGGGANDSIVQIMCRIAGADLNYAGNAAARVVNTFNNAALTSPIDFAGGANGPWGYWWASYPVFGKAYPAASPTYGIATNAPPSPAAISATADTIYVRTKRSGANIVVSTYNTGAANAIGVTLLARRYVFDAGTVWSGDSGEFGISTTSSSGSGTSTLTFNGPFAWIAEARGGMRYTHDGANIAAALLLRNANVTGSVAEFTNVIFEEGPTCAGFTFGAYDTHYNTYNGVRLRLRAGRILTAANANGTPWISRWIDCDIEYYVAAATPVGIVSLANPTGSTTDTLVEFTNCRFTFAANGPITQPFSGTNTNSNFRAIFRNCIGIRPETMPALASNTGGNRSLIFTGCADQGSGTIARSSMIDNGHSQVSWIDNNTLPYLDAVVPTGSYWSLKELIKAGRSSWVHVTLASIFGLYRAADAAKVLSVEVLVPTGVVFNKSQLGARFTFTDSAGQINHVSTLESYVKVIAGAENPIATSSAAWSRASSLDARKLTFDTASIGKSIKQGTEIACEVVYIGNAPAGLDRTIFIHPEVKIT